MDSLLAFETLQGGIIALLFGLGSLLVIKLPKYKWIAASLVSIVVSILALLPIWFSYGELGISDWDYYFSMHTNIRDTITTSHQFPLWNPYTCGGTSALGDPEFPALSPLFLFEIAFGTPIGIKLSIFASTIIAALGMLHLARKINIGVLGGLVASLGMSLGTVSLLEIVEGHQNILAAMCIPWILYCWYTAYTSEGSKKYRSNIISAILLALMFFQGGIYLLMYMAGAFIALILFVKNKKKAFFITCITGILALGLASVKIIPVANWVGQFQDTAYASSTYTLPYLHKIFMGRILHGAEDVIPNQGGGWHEYGAYIGPVVLVLALIGLLTTWKNRIVRALFISAIIATLISSLGPLLKPAFDQLSFIPRSNVSRIILFAVIPLSLLAGFGIDNIQKRSKLLQYAAVLLVTLAGIDIISLTYPLVSQAFVLPHVVHPIPKAPEPISYSPFEYKYRHNGVDYTRAYDATLQGYGNMTYCSVLSPIPAVEIITDEGNKGILSFSDDKQATFVLEKWTPNTVTLKTHVTQKTSALLNANYAKGWFVNGMPAKEIRNRVGVDMQPGDTTLTFSYTPPGMYAGIGITILTIIIVILLLKTKLYLK